ncbi:cytochrome P450 [Mycolicibacterium aromaticivorans JS19b1 = JCM 16368]|uniref:Steroid C26-monooxygenase n=1 Tax=Mycolicibacterium aromaticivorans JS19b1 = JCM 16368 TaxID=1440774 RepID=A0A064CIS1_9MYCO|nr:cytochrome P450 [Mycolicibacterium aromaticivorans]KDF00216.1 cytochrome P450 [Mycolicibacterium aromaticivorans JS19b1 = JCM 16368]
MTTRIMDEAARVLANPQAYTDEAGLHGALAHLRAHAPVSWVDVEGYRPFWAITKHADIMDIERQNDLFTNDPRPILVVQDLDDKLRADREAGAGLSTLIHIDDPHHRDLRKIGADWFRPKAMRALKARCDELAKMYVGQMVERGPELDFAQEIAVNFPLYVILTLLGLPESDFPRMLKLTQELFGGDDSEFQRAEDKDAMIAVLLDFFGYFSALTASRREHPTEDLTSAIANATINGEPLSDMDTASYYVIVASAGHDTTSAGIAGGLLELIRNPGELQRLQNDPSLMGTAVEEMIRCIVPVKEFMRTAQADTEVRGVPIAKGEAVLLSYVSANRDEEVFADPMRFDVGRDPNKHLSFGYGVHFCLGAALARMEMNSFFTELVPRIKSIELAGEPELMATTFVGGVKHLPIRYSLR